MRSHDTSKSTNNLYYEISDIEINAKTKVAALCFKEFKKNSNLSTGQVALKKGLNEMLEAIQLCQNALKGSEGIKKHNADQYYDLAFCQRKYASMVIRDESDIHRYEKAREALNSVLSIFSDNVSEKEVIQFEIQRALHQMRKLAYEQKDGDLLKDVVTKLQVLANKYSSTNYMLDCYDSLFHLAFADSNFPEALAVIEKKMRLQKIQGLEIDSSISHEVKTHLAMLAKLPKEDQKSHFLEKIEKRFWNVYDLRKNAIEESPLDKKANERMLKTFILLFNIRCQKSLLGLPGKNPIPYVLAQAKGIFKDEKIYARLTKILNHKAEEIRKNHFLPLDYQFFADKPVPGIVFSSAQIETILPKRPARYGSMYSTAKGEGGHNLNHEADKFKK